MSGKRSSGFDWVKFVKEWVVTIAAALTLAFFFRTTIASPRHIPTGSMIPTIKIGEFIFVKMYAYDWHIPFTRKSFMKRADPKAGEIVVFEYPEDPSKDYIKRVIGVPGDTVEVRERRVFVNGTPYATETMDDTSLLDDLTPKYHPETMSLLKETTGETTHYIAYMNDRIPREQAPTQLPENCYFVMGDNRDDSQDSRYWGCVPREKILGQAGFRWFSINLDRFPPPLRISRFFQFLE